MSSFEWNKIIASVLTAMIVAMVAGILSSELVRPKRLEQPVYLPPGAEAGAAASTAAPGQAPAKVEPIEPALAKADPKHGEQLTKPCLQCHTFGKGEPNKIGPNLFGILGQKAGTVQGFNYTRAFKAAAEWTWNEDLVAGWIGAPGQMVPGTAMGVFQGVAQSDRDDIVAYLATQR